eukprot:CFRG2325T1
MSNEVSKRKRPDSLTSESVPSADTNHGHVLRSVASAATYNVALQLAIRTFTFLINSVLLRRLSPETIGVVNVRLALYSSTCLLLAREAIRKVCMEYKYDRWIYVAWLVWASIPFGVLIVGVLGYAWINLLEQPDDSVPNYDEGVWLFGLSVILELACEPMYIYCQAHFLVGGRVIVEGVALLCKCVLTVFLVVLVPEWGLRIFGLSGCVYSCCLLVGWSLYVRYQQSLTTHQPPLPVRTLKGLLLDPSKIKFDENTQKIISLSFSFTKQSVLKQFLTEGERFIMSLFPVIDFAAQGVFDVVSNLGSLVARFLFQPIEESYYLFFTTILHRQERDNVYEYSKNTVVGRRGSQNDLVHRKLLAARALSTLLKFSIILGLVFVSFGPPYTTILLDIYGGHTISTGVGPSLLSWYCLYVLLLGVNGITECFLIASADRGLIDRYNHLMIGFSVVFLATSLTLTRTRLGAAGFIVANCVNMGLRILYGANYAHEYFKPSPIHTNASISRHPLRYALPSRILLATLFVSACVTSLSHVLLLETFSFEDEGIPYSTRELYLARAQHVGVGLVALVITFGVFLFSEKRFICDLRKLYSGTFIADEAKAC